VDDPSGRAVNLSGSGPGSAELERKGKEVGLPPMLNAKWRIDGGYLLEVGGKRKKGTE